MKIYDRCQAISWTNVDLVHRRIYASLGFSELEKCPSLPIQLFTRIALSIDILTIYNAASDVKCRQNNNIFASEIDKKLYI